MFTDPVKNLKALGLEENNIVADLGAGTGFYAMEAGKLVPKGKVYAVEVIKDYLMTVKNRARDEKVNNVECIWGNIEKLGGTKIKDSIVDAVIVSNVLFQVDHKDNFLKEIKRILKPRGKVLFVDWLPGSSAVATSSGRVIPKAKAVGMFEEKGFVLDREIDAGEHHYGMIFRNTHEK
ncbi:methyltransferase domain-containing protein [Candidatus Nomurabacteria bacterium]|nr:methyltransferase domain-containing protein [Candidatus Nomurabacteria bacterium]